MYLIQVKNLNYVYSEGMPYETAALTDVSFNIEPQEFVGIIGHTGSGKSTLIQHLNGLLHPKSGRILIGDTDITAKDIKLRDIRRKIGLVFQYPEYQLFEETVERDVAYGPMNLGLTEEETKDRVKEAIDLVGLDYDEIALRSPFELSGGQKRRVAIAGVIAMKPELLILDEPTAGLDPRAHDDILNMIEKIHKMEKNVTILVSHNMDDVARLADRVIVMEKGRIALNGTPREVFEKGQFLHSLGLGLPPAAELMEMLKEKGFSIEQNPLTIDEAEETIYQLLQKE